MFLSVYYTSYRFDSSRSEDQIIFNATELNLYNINIQGFPKESFYLIQSLCERNQFARRGHHCQSVVKLLNFDCRKEDCSSKMPNYNSGKFRQLIEENINRIKVRFRSFISFIMQLTAFQHSSTLS